MATRRTKPAATPPPAYTISDVIRAMHGRFLYDGGAEEDWQPPSEFLEDWRVTTDEWGEMEFTGIGDDGEPFVRVRFILHGHGSAFIRYADGRTLYTSIEPIEPD